jgi:hypothetical protein
MNRCLNAACERARQCLRRSLTFSSLMFEPLPNDHFDGPTSVWSHFGAHTLRHGLPEQRVKLRKKPHPCAKMRCGAFIST